MNREPDFGILDEDGNVVSCRNMLEWAHKFEIKNRIIEQTQLPNGLFVSTIFMGINHNSIGERPLWFETMVFGPRGDDGFRPEAGYCERYNSLEEARAGHALAIEWASNQGEFINEKAQADKTQGSPDSL